MGAFVYAKQLKRHTLSELVPVESFDEETHLFTMADGYIGFGFVAKPLPGGDESVTQRLNVLFSFDYPKESFIQIMLMGSQDIRPTLDNIKHIRNTKDEALQESLNNRLKMLTEGSNQAISLHAQSYVREYKVVFTIKLPLQQKNQLPKQHEISVARDLRLSFEQTLKSAGFVPQTMDAELYLRVVGQILHWSPSANWRCPAKYYDATTPVNEQLSEYDDMIQTDVNGVWLGGKRLRILSPGRLQGQMSLQNMRRMIGDPLTGARGIHGNFFINLNIFIPDNAAEKQKADKERNVINYQAFGPMLKFNPKLIFKKESTDLLFKSINDGDRILKIKLCVGLFTDSLDKSKTG